MKMRHLHFLFLMVATLTLTVATAQKKSGSSKSAGKTQTKASSSGDELEIPVPKKNSGTKNTTPDNGDLEVPLTPGEMALLPSEPSVNPPSKKVIAPKIEEYGPMPDTEKFIKWRNEENDLQKAWKKFREEQAETVADLRDKKWAYKPNCTLNPNRQLPSLVKLAKEIPDPLLPTEAKRLNLSDKNNPYDAYIERMKRLIKDVSEKTKAYASITKKTPEQVKKEAEQRAQADYKGVEENPMIKSMGGMEKVKNMSEAERREAARTAAVNNPQMMAPAGMNDPAMVAFMEKMKDPKYAAAYNKMSDKEKMLEFQKVSSASGGSGTLVKVNKTATAGDEATELFREAEELREMTAKQIMERVELVAKQQAKINKAYDDIQKQTAATYKKMYDALPEVAMGEAGHNKNSRPLDVTYAMKNYKNGLDRAAADLYAFRNYKLSLEDGIAYFDACLDKYWKKGGVPEINGVDGVAVMGAAIVGQLEQYIQRAEEARRMTSLNAGLQCNMETVLYGDCKK